MFFGQFHHRLNSKSQVTVPARFRELIPKDEKLYILRTNPEALYLYSHPEMERIVARMRERAGAVDPEFRRMLTSRVTPVDMDAQGRIVIPAELKAAVGIETDVAFVGNAERIEIWPLDRWQGFEREREADYQQKLGGMIDDLFER